MKLSYCLQLLFVALLMGGCRQQIDVQGTTSLPLMEGKMLYLRAFADADLQTLDSARVVHGKFRFSGAVPDSVVFASLFIGDESIMPVVLDGNALTITLNETDHKVTGSTLNDTLFAFIRRKNVLDRQLAELPRRESQMILNGMDHDEILAQLSAEAARLDAQNNEMVVRFIKDNMDNVLGAGVFMVVTSSLPYPILNPQIEELITLGTPAFRNNAYVQEYLRLARENMERMQD